MGYLLKLGFSVIWGNPLPIGNSIFDIYIYIYVDDVDVVVVLVLEGPRRVTVFATCKDMDAWKLFVYMLYRRHEQN